MHWLKLFGVLVTFAFVVTTAEGTRKKIRIHIPQKVKNVYHHKKIYITNHPASSQYAPAYLPTAESSLKISSAVFVPAQNLLPPSVFENRGSRHLQTVASSESKVLPLYRARGYYGPPPEWEDQEFDLVPPPGPSGPTATAFLPTAFSEPIDPIPSSDSSVKRIRIVKVHNPHRKKKVVRKRKPKRIIMQNMAKEESTHPVPPYHEQFYADVDDFGTIRKIKKPKRVEKIVDGDTEHIHTYSEEHIHKLIFDDAPKIRGISGIDPTASMSALTEANPLFPIKNSQSLLSIPPTKMNSFSNFDTLSASGTIGSLGTPSHMEYIGYDPQEVTHDHVFHDHGEISPTVDITKESLSRPPKVTYDSQGSIISDSELTTKSSHKNKWSPPNDILQHMTPSQEPDFSYYENMYSTTSKRPKKARRTKKRPTNDSYLEQNNGINEFSPVPYLRYKENSKSKIYDSLPHYNQENKQLLHEYRENKGSGSTLLKSLNFVDRPIKAPKNIYTDTRPALSTLFSEHRDSVNSFGQFEGAHDFDAYDNDKVVSWPIQNKGKKKSISTQNISFGGQDHKTVINHMADTYDDESIKPTNLRESSNNFISNRWTDMVTSSPSLFTIKDNSPLHEYYTAMALKAFHDDHLPAASNNNLQIIDAPSTAPTKSLSTAATTMISSPTYNINPTVETTTVTSPTNQKLRRRLRPKNLRSGISHIYEASQNDYIPSSGIQISEPSARSFVSQATILQNAKHPRSRHIEESLSDNMDDDSQILPVRKNSKYGDKL